MDIWNNSNQSSAIVHDIWLEGSDCLEANRLNRTQLYTITPFFVSLLIIGLLGNLATCIVIISRKPMHTATNFYLFSLALSDILILLINVPRSLFILWTETYIYWFELCYSVIGETGANASILTVTVLSVERYFAICRPFYKKCIMSNLLVANRCIAGIWVASIVLAVVIIVLGDYERFSDLSEKIYIVFSAVLFFVVPVTLMSIFYINICSTITKYKNDVDKKIEDNEAKAIKILVAILTMFIICWTPFHVQRILVTYDMIGEYENYIFYVVSNLLYILSPVLNPVLYSLMSEKFRREFQIVFAKCLPSDKTRKEDPQNVSMSLQNTRISIESDSD